MKPRALVIEPDFSGHRWRYAKWCAEALVEAGYACIIATDASNRTHPVVDELAIERPEVAFAFHRREDVRASMLHRALGRAKQDFIFHGTFAALFRATCRERSIDLVVVPYGDYIFNALALLGSPFGATPWLCIVMRQSFHLRDMGVDAPHQPWLDFVKRQLYFLALRRGKPQAVLTIDPTLAIWHARSRGARLPARVEYLADPFPEVAPIARDAARARLSLPAEPTILVYGAISDRKGIKELVNACLVRDEHPLVVVAGRQSDDVRAFLAAHSPRLGERIVIFDRFIPAEMEADLFAACDAVWVGYKGHFGMSGVLVQAYRFGKPVLATREGLIGWFAQHDQLGPLLDDLSITTVNAAIDKAFASAGGHRQAVQAPGAEKLLARNTVTNFKKTLQSALAGG